MSYDLTICIITYNRGKRALENVENLLENIKDNCCVLVLDNGSSLESEEYKKIEELSKTNEQLTYKRHETNILVHGNFRSCFTYAQTKYIKIMSDEDFVNANQLDLLLLELKQSKANIGACRPSIAPYPGLKNPGNSITYGDKFLNAREEAFFYFTFLGNYISGIIYNAEDIKKTKILEVFDENIQSYKAYPHLYLDVLVCSQFDVLISSKQTVWEREGEETLIETGTKSVAKKHVGLYGYGERINQFLAFRDAIVDGIELADTENDGQKVKIFFHTYLRLAQKYYFLIFKVNMANFVSNRMEASLLRESFFYLSCSAVVDHPYLGPKENKDLIVNKLVEFFQGYKDS